MGLAGFVAGGFFEFGGFFGTGFEAVDATFGVDDFFFASEEGVRGGRNLDFNKWVFFAVGPFGGFFGGGGGFREKRKIGLLIHEDDGTIIFRVD